MAGAPPDAPPGAAGAAAESRRVRVTGAVQGVGFRPFVHGLAVRHGLRGTVANTEDGVLIEAAADPAAWDRFLGDLGRRAPPLARVERVAVEPAPPVLAEGFTIAGSVRGGGTSQPVPADAGICAACRRELLDPRDRRFLHPFVNCTDCGPRLTIVEDLPYDRPHTTMAKFPMCPACAAEYADPADRRFHAEPVACRACGPRVRLLRPDGTESARDDGAVREARRLLAAGRVVALKGIGGYQLACDAADAGAVGALRERKARPDKPFALMAADLDAVRGAADVGDDEAAVLASAARPVVLLRRRPAARVAPGVAPGRDTLGVMLPCAPLHELLFAPAADLPDAPRVLVVTSGNAGDEPIAIADDDALRRLGPLCDALLVHDREIRTRCDDSVVRVVGGRTTPLRRARGYAPLPVALPLDAPPILAVGADLKNAFCVARDRRAYVGPHVGDLGGWEALAAFEESVARFERLFRVRPVAIAHDLHPDHVSARWALARAAREGLRAVAVQHHHAHVAACLVENGRDGRRPVLGVAFDGTGHGTDGASWGGEFLVADLRHFVRAAHLAYVPLPGGDAAVRRPWRTALAWLRAAGVGWTDDLAPVAAAGARGAAAVDAQIRAGGPRTSSAGRLFDAVASIAGVRQTVTCEGQAAAELEALADPGACDPYPLPGETTGPLDLTPLVRAVADDVRRGAAPGTVSARFHESVARLVRDVAVAVRAQHGTGTAALSGGVFQNARLLGRTRFLLAEAGFDVLDHHVVPPNDGGLALGQAAVAAAILREEL